MTRAKTTKKAAKKPTKKPATLKPNPNDPAYQARRWARLRKVESLLFNGFKAHEIFGFIGEAEGVTYGTIRNDISAIYKARKAELAELNKLEGAGGYLSRLQAVRRAAMADKDLRLVHKLDMEIARLCGVAVDPKHQVSVSVDEARGFMQRVMERIFTVVTDKETQDRIVAVLENDAESAETGGE